MPSGSYLKQPLHVPARWLLEVTTTFARPKAAPPGVVPVIWVVPITVRPASSVPPIVTLVTSMKLAPVIVMLVPPTIGPVAGLTAVTLIAAGGEAPSLRSEEHTSELQSHSDLVCRLLLEKKKKKKKKEQTMYTHYT